MLETDKELKRKRKAFDTDEGAVMAEKNAGDGTGNAGGEASKMGRLKKVGGGDEEGEPKKKKKKKEKKGGDGMGDDASTVRSG